MIKSLPYYYVNVSSIKSFMSCRYRWICQWILNRVPVGTERPLRWGKLLHEIFEDYFTLPREGEICSTSGTMEEIIRRRREEWLRQSQELSGQGDIQEAQDALADLDEYKEVLCLWSDHYPVDNPPLEVEQSFVVSSPFDPSIVFIGRPDRVATLWGRVFHVQNRSIAATMNFGRYIELAKRHLHEHVYALHLSKKYKDIPYGGTLFNMLRKLQYRSKRSGKIIHPITEILWQHPVNIDVDGEKHKKMVEEATRYAQEMRVVERRFREDGIWPLPNEEMNDGFYHNKIDPYFKVLEGEVGINDDNYFKDREERYADLDLEPIND